MNQNKSVFNSLIIAVAIIIAGVIVFMESDKFLKNQAIDNCLKSANYTSKIGNASGKNKTVEPMKIWYEFCMKEKAYK